MDKTLIYKTPHELYKQVSLEKKFVFIEAFFTDGKDSVVLSLDELRALHFIEGNTVFHYQDILENTPFGSLGKLFIQESKELIKKGLVELVNGSRPHYNLTEKALCGDYGAMMLNRKKLDI